MMKVLDSDRHWESLLVEFVDAEGESVITGQKDRLVNWRSGKAKPSDVTVTIRFMDS